MPYIYDFQEYAKRRRAKCNKLENENIDNDVSEELLERIKRHRAKYGRLEYKSIWCRLFGYR